VHRERADHGQGRRRERDVQQVTPEREVEDIEANVEAELGVLDAEVDPVAEQQPLLPVGLPERPANSPITTDSKVIQSPMRGENNIR
jgi:hypothetical protein